MSIIPIQVEMTVEEDVLQVEMEVEEDVLQVEMETEDVIVVPIPEYSGPYTVTPSEQEQILETEDLKMVDDVTVEAIPDDYVGSDIPRRSSSDLTADGPTVTAPAGYYAEGASKAIPYATPMPGLHAFVSPYSVTVNSSGLVNASVGSTTQPIVPVRTAGYAPSDFKATFAIYGGSKTLQLDTQTGRTITPTESVQTAVQAQKYTTGAVKVDAIPSNYVGSAVPRRDENDLTVSGDTVTVPAGFYEETEIKSVQGGSATTPDDTITVTPSITVDPSTGEITAAVSGSKNITPTVVPGFVSEGTAGTVSVSGSNTASLPTVPGDTITPTKQEQTAVLGGKFTLGDVKVGPIPSQYYDMSGPLAWLGAGAELVKEIELSDVALKDTAFASWNPSTTATDILATRTAGTFSAASMSSYDYFVVWETKIPVVYKEGSVNKAKPLYLVALHMQTIIRRPSSMTNILANNANNNINASAFTGGNFLRYYGSTQGTITYTWSTSYGFYGTVTANTFSSTTAESPTVTLKTPKITARCSTTYMSTANAALIDQEKTVIKQSCKVYRVKRANFFQGCFDMIGELVREMEA